MKPFRLARRPRPGVAPVRPAAWRPRAAAPGRRWLTTLAGTCLAAVLVGWPVMLAGHGVTAPGPAVSAPGPAVSVVLTAMQGPQARVLNPGPPTGLTATAGNAQVTLSWRAPTSDGGAAIIGYDVYLGTSPHGESASPVNGAALIAGTSYTVTGLKNGTTYYFTADAVNDASLHSAASGETSATPAAPVTAPGAPAGLTAAAGDAQVSLSWQAPGSDGGAQITSYNVYEGTGSNITGKPVASAQGTGATIKNLTNGTTYFFKVTAVNKAGEGPASGAASATPTAAITNPGPPNGLTASPGNGQVTLSWAAPASDGGASISGYEIYRGTRPGGESSVPVNGTPVQATSYTLTGLTNGTTYYFTVAAVNQASRQGGASGEASATPVSATAPATSASPATSTSSAGATGAAGAGGAPGAPAGLTATAGNAEVSLSWTAPASVGGSPPASYHVYAGTSPGFIPGAAVSSTTSTNATVTGLTNGTTYYFVVTAVDANGKVSGTSGEVSAMPTGTAVLAATSKKVPKPVIVSLAAVAVGATAGALTLTARRLRKRPRPRPPLAPPSDVRAVPDKVRPGPVTLHEIGVEETYTVRLEPLPAAIITTIEEIST
jgi:predicted phage tail protein